MAVKKVSVSLAVEVHEIATSWPSRYHGACGLSTMLQEIVLDMDALLQRATCRVEKSFSDAELNYIYDMLNSTLIIVDGFGMPAVLAFTVTEADKYEGLGKKWQVDPAKLAEKVGKLPEFDAYALAKMADRYWQEQN